VAGVHWLYLPASEIRNNIYQSKRLEIALTETLSSDFDMNNLLQGFFDSISVGYFGRSVANVVQVNPDRKVQLITSYYAPLEIVLNFHSNKLVLSGSLISL